MSRFAMLFGSVAVLTTLLYCCGGACSCSELRCVDYVTCADAIGGAEASGVDSKYGTMGTCWTTTQGADEACVSECTVKLQQLKVAYPDAGCH